MKTHATLQAHQLEKFAQFLEEHPGFVPLLFGQDALVCGFQVGGSYLGITELEKMIATQSHFDAQEAALLLAPMGAQARLL
jgi:CBS-domain-containing membrane protein